jgi:histone deacetylase 11
MHHAYHDNGGGWCVYDDWTIALRMLRRETGGKVQKAILIDLDVHQVPAPALLVHDLLRCKEKI